MGACTPTTSVKKAETCQRLIRRHDVMTSKRHTVTMSDARKATVYFDSDIHRALKLKAASTDRSISEMVNDAVRLALAEDVEDLEAFEETADEPDLDVDLKVESNQSPEKYPLK